jgi:hypothetical protein
MMASRCAADPVGAERRPKARGRGPHTIGGRTGRPVQALLLPITRSMCFSD